MSKSYIDSAYYNIRLTSRFIKAFIAQELKKLNVNITTDEVFALDILKKKGAMSQRDLAKILFRDRANTGKIAMGLKEKGLIEINAEQKNNRLIKQLSLSKKGAEFLNEVIEKSKPVFDKISQQFTPQEEELLRTVLNKLRTSLGSIIDSQI